MPAWLKGATLFVAYPACGIIMLCVVMGKSESPLAIAAFVSFAVVALLHVVFDERNRRGGPNRDRGVDISDGGE